MGNVLLFFEWHCHYVDRTGLEPAPTTESEYVIL